MRFVRQPLTIRVRNCDDRLRIMRATRRNISMVRYYRVCAIVCGLSNCVKSTFSAKINAVSLLESPIRIATISRNDTWSTKYSLRKRGNILSREIRFSERELLRQPFGQHDVDFKNVYVYSKSLQQPKYQYLENLLSIDKIGYFTFSNNSDVVPPSEAHLNSIFIFDDVACDKQDMREYFSMGRHSHVDCFYLC